MNLNKSSVIVHNYERNLEVVPLFSGAVLFLQGNYILFAFKSPWW